MFIAFFQVFPSFPRVEKKKIIIYKVLEMIAILLSKWAIKMV